MEEYLKKCYSLLVSKSRMEFFERLPSSDIRYKENYESKEDAEILELEFQIELEINDVAETGDENELTGYWYKWLVRILIRTEFI